MKKISIAVIAALMTAQIAAAQILSSERMPIYADLGGIVLTEDGQEVGVYPTQVTLEGQWCDVRLWSAPFSVIEYPRFRVELQRGIAQEKVIQLFARNAWTSSNYLGPYVTFEKNQVVLEGSFADIDTECYFDDDPICTWFAIQYMQKEKVTIHIKDVVLINEDGGEIHSHNIRNDSWKPSPDCIDPDTVLTASVKFTSKGVVGPYIGKVEYNQAHRFIFNTEEPMPEGLVLFLVLDDGDYTTYEYEVPAGSTQFVSPIIEEDYARVYIEYDGDFPRTMKFNSIIRETLDITGVGIPESDNWIPTSCYSIDGKMQNIGTGLSILYGLDENGKPHAVKTFNK